MKHLLLILLLALAVGCSPRDFDDSPGPGDSTDTGPGTGDTTAFTDPERLSIYDLRNPASTLRPAIGTEIALTRVVVTAIDTFQEVDDQVRRTGNFWVQERSGGEYSGIHVFNGPTNAPPVVDISSLSVGDEVTVRGVFGSSFGRAQIAVASLEVTGQRDPVVTVVDAADVATGGLLAEEYESVLVQVLNAEVTESNAGFGRFQVSGDLLVGNNLHRVAGFPPPRGLTYSSITGVMDFAFEERSILPRAAADLAFDDLPSGDVYEIMALRDPENPERPARGSVVRVEGAVVTAVDRFREVEDDRVRTGSFFIQDINGGPWSGIYVFNAGGDTVNVDDLQPGDVVTVDGVYDVFFDFDQISVTSFQITGSENLPPPAVVAPASIATDGSDARQWESVPVRVEDVTVTDSNAGFGQFKVTDDLRIGNNLYRVPTALRNVGQEFARIDGLLVFTFNEHVLMPRAASDVATEAGTEPTDPTDPTDPPDTPTFSIFDLKDPALADDRPAFGASVVLEDVMIVAIDRFLQPSTMSQNRVNQFWVQEPDGGPWSGLRIFNRHSGGTWTVDVTDLDVGDIVRLEGTFARFPETSEVGLLQVEVTGLTVTGAGTPPEPATLTTEALGNPTMETVGPWEGQLVQMENVEVISSDGLAQFGELGLAGGGRLSNELSSLAEVPVPSEWSQVTGLLNLLVVSGNRLYSVAPTRPEDMVPAE